MSIRVLIGNDSPETVPLINFLRKYGIHVDQCESNGRIIKEILLTPQIRFDVVILESKMPEMDTVDFLKFFRDAIGIPKKIVISRYDNINEERILMESGADSYVLAPYDLNDMVSLIEALTLNDDAPSGLILSLRKRVSDILVEVGISKTIKGHHYLREVIIRYIMDQSIVSKGTKKVYEEIAKEYGTIAPRVERAINHAISLANVDDLESHDDISFIDYMAKKSQIQIEVILPDKEESDDEAGMAIAGKD